MSGSQASVGEEPIELQSRPGRAIGLQLRPGRAIGRGIALAGKGVCRAGDWLRRAGEGFGAARAAAAGRLIAAPSAAAAPVIAASLDPITLAFWLWGDGHLVPGSVDEMLDLVRPFYLHGSARLLHLGAGLGTMSLAISKQTGCRVSGYESDAALLARASAAVHASKRVTLSALGPTGPMPSGPRWDHCCGRFALHREADPRALLIRCRAGMLPGGHISLVEYAAPAGQAGLASWIARQPGMAGEIWPIERWRHAFASAGFDLRIEEDVSARHRAAILSGWHRLLTGRHLIGIPKRQLEPMVHAAERWMAEAMLIQSGALQVRRFYALMLV